MTEFEYRTKTFQTPKTRSRTENSSLRGAVTKSTFKRAGKRVFIETVTKLSEEPFQYSPVAIRKQRKTTSKSASSKSNELSPKPLSEVDSATINHEWLHSSPCSSTTQKSLRISKRRTGTSILSKVGAESLSSPVLMGAPNEEGSPLHTSKQNPTNETNTNINHISEFSSTSRANLHETSSPVKPVHIVDRDPVQNRRKRSPSKKEPEKSVLNTLPLVTGTPTQRDLIENECICHSASKRNHTNLQKLLKPFLKEELEKIKKDNCTITSAFIGDALQAVSKTFLASIGNLKDIDLVSKNVIFKENTVNQRLKRKEKVLRYLIQKFSEELEQWQEIEMHHQILVTIESPLNDVGTNIDLSSSNEDLESLEEQKKRFQRCAEALILQTDQMKPVLRRIGLLRSNTEDEYKELVSSVHRVAFKDINKSTKELIKSAIPDPSEILYRMQPSSSSSSSCSSSIPSLTSTVDTKRLIRNAFATET